ncbi:MAG TPA: response regulator [Gemmatimonadales bacterium]|nr:response regulator [Gemmatimonadales bacterium]
MATDAHARREPLVYRHPGHILVVEDDADDFELLDRAFRKVELAEAVVRARDGEEAIQVLSEAVAPRPGERAPPLPALLLLDVKLPCRSGLEVLRWIRGEAGLRRLPVVMLSGSREPGDIATAYELGANSYLVKPVGLGPLVDLVRAIRYYWLTLNERPDLRGDNPA